MRNIFTMMSSCKKLFHLIIIVISDLLGAFERSQCIAVVPRCVGIRPHACFPLEPAAVDIVLAREKSNLGPTTIAS